MTTITASNPVTSLSFLSSLPSLDCAEIVTEVRIAHKTVKVTIPLSDDDYDTFYFLNGSSSSDLDGFIHSVVKTWLSENLRYKCKIVNFHVNTVRDFSDLVPFHFDESLSRPAYELPLLSSEPVRYNLHTVDIEEEEGIPFYTLEYLCDDADWAHAVINYHHGRNLRCDVSLNNKQYYPGIENDHPNAKIIPSIRKETREDLMGLR
ncbi:MAG: hypothetical protein V7K67_21490 [Nostoc sp.]|uniref:hypothetical protein n=1 Tax=Nostoc sp. TaxID=1180 RepID=UPI002FF62834